MFHIYFWGAAGFSHWLRRRAGRVGEEENPNFLESGP